jgi:single-strand DNA-binding protein
MVNKVTLIGNLGRDPEVRHLEGGATVAKFPIATNENYRDRNGEWQTNTEWHDVVVWRQLAERAERDFKKGMLVYVEGKLRKRKYQDKDGIDRYVVEIVANSVKVLERRESRQENEGYFPGSEDSPSVTGQSRETAVFDVKEPKESTNISSDTETEDDLPF